MHRYYVIYKPYRMLSQFSPGSDRPSLASLHRFPKDVYPVGRLDADSEGLLVLTNDSALNSLLLDPAHGHARSYHVQVEGRITKEHTRLLENGMDIRVNRKNYRTAPCQARPVGAPDWLPPRHPPVRFRKTVPDSWLEITLREGKHRQVRKMTSAAGFPTLRLVRTAIESLSAQGMMPGDVVEYDKKELYRLLRLEQSSI